MNYKNLRQMNSRFSAKTDGLRVRLGRLSIRLEEVKIRVCPAKPSQKA